MVGPAGAGILAVLAGVGDLAALPGPGAVVLLPGRGSWVVLGVAAGLAVGADRSSLGSIGPLGVVAPPAEPGAVTGSGPVPVVEVGEPLLAGSPGESLAGGSVGQLNAGSVTAGPALADGLATAKVPRSDRL
jgi:hypothetical protein